MNNLCKIVVATIVGLICGLTTANVVYCHCENASITCASIAGGAAQGLGIGLAIVVLYKDSF